MFRLYETTNSQTQWSASYLKKDDVLGVDGLAKKKFEGLNVYHKYQCGVRVVVSEGINTNATFVNKFTKNPKEVKPCLHLIVTLSAYK